MVARLTSSIRSCRRPHRLPAHRGRGHFFPLAQQLAFRLLGRRAPFRAPAPAPPPSRHRPALQADAFQRRFRVRRQHIRRDAEQLQILRDNGESNQHSPSSVTSAGTFPADCTAPRRWSRGREFVDELEGIAFSSRMTEILRTKGLV
jgi:hypothetical protein